MNKRIFLVGLVGGLLLSGALIYPLYCFPPSLFVEGWPAADQGTVMIFLAVGAALLLLTGFLAGRLGGTALSPKGKNRLGAAGAGAIAGLVAAFLAETLLGGAAAGTWGARLLLANGLVPAANNTEYISLLTHGVASTIWWTYLSIWVAAGCGLLLGGLGGLAAGSAGTAAQPQSELWLTVSVAGVFASALDLLIVAVVYTLLATVTQDAAGKVGISLPYSAGKLIAWPAATGLAWLLFWQAVAWLVIRRLPADRSMAFLNGILMPILTLFVLPFVFSLVMARNLLNTPSAYMAIGAALVVVAVLLTLAAVWRNPRPRTSPPGETFLRRGWAKVSGFFERAGTARVAAWTLLIIDLLLALLLYQATRSVFLLPWMAGGLAIGFLLGVLGVFASYWARPTSDGEPVHPMAGEYLSAALISQMFPVVLLTLSTLAPLSLVLIPVVMIASLMPPFEGQVAATAGTMTLPQVVQLNYYAQASMTLAAWLAAAVVALMVTAFRTYLQKLGARNRAEQVAEAENAK